MSAPNPTPDVGGLNPADIMKPLSDEWRTYSGDLTGKRYSLLKQVNTTTVKNLGLQWMTRSHNGLRSQRDRAGRGGACRAGGLAAAGAPRPRPEKIIIGGLGDGRRQYVRAARTGRRHSHGRRRHLRWHPGQRLGD